MHNTKYVRHLFLTGIIVFFVLINSGTSHCEDYKTLLDMTLNNLTWRNIGPAIPGGRIADFAVVESNPFIIYCGTASGGLWKTINNGVTWMPIFDDQTTSTIGALALAPSNPEIIWVGTGEANNRQSSSWGDGVYKSNDGGKTWIHLGLENTHHIGAIVVDSHDSDVVYVAAAGHLWGANPERGVYKTTDGGRTWTNVLFVNNDTGCIDVAQDPSNNKILYAAMYQRRRRGWGFIGGGPGSGLYKTTDAGKTWTQLKKGLPGGDTGRIGIDIYRKDPNIVYAILENKNGGVFRSEDRGETWQKMSSTNPRPMYYSTIRIDPNNDLRIWVLGTRMLTSYDGGRTFRTDVVSRVHVDHHALWINPANSNHMVLGNDGGICFSYDRGLTWDFVDTLPIGQFYEVGFDMRKPYNIYGGLQDAGTWGGPSATRNKIGITNADWPLLGVGDGFYTQADPNDPDTLYWEASNGSLRRKNLYTRETKSIFPQPESEQETYRFNWNSPIEISPHKSSTIYLGGNKLFKSTDRGETWTASPDLTTKQDRNKLLLMGILPDKNTLSLHDGIAFYGDITTISESPVKEGVLWVGTDDGNLQLSKDGGSTWLNLIDRVPGIPEFTYVSRVEASHFDEKRAYVTFDGHRNDDFSPYAYVTDDFGQTWKSISSPIPEGSTINVIREHHRNPNLLFIGTERGAYFSIDRGQNWNKINGDIPIVPVDDIAIHPRDNDLILGTHGRSVFVLDDITPLEELNQEVLRSECHLFSVRPAERFQFDDRSGFPGYKIFIAPNPDFGAFITYYLNLELKKDEEVIIAILDDEGNAVKTLKGTKKQGFNRINWDLRYESPDIGEQRRFGPSAPYVIPGEYTIRLTLRGNSMTASASVEIDPRIKVSTADLIAQRDAALEINKLYVKGVSITERVQDIMEQTQELKKNIDRVEDLDKELQSDIASLEKTLNDIRRGLAGSGGGREARSVFRMLGSLGRDIIGYTDAPTALQIKRIKNASDKIDSAVIAINTVITESVPELNKKISEYALSIIHPGTVIK